MSVELQEQADSNLLIVRVTEKLHKQDYESFVPEVERLIKQFGKLRVLLEMHDFHGWDAGALWKDTMFDLKHFNDIEKLAVVGEKKWEQGMAKFCAPFTTAKVKYFPSAERAEAIEWITAS